LDFRVVSGGCFSVERRQRSFGGRERKIIFLMNYIRSISNTNINKNQRGKFWGIDIHA
jgi:hypothetical protein